ncbi:MULTISPECIES: class I SAM-dependent methyltransferase [Prescottella]|jgi:SAM-dependent methyltransferase|uniref:class I SAM-dependent methyltransferase n=1 Tax=Prescottella TaxID=2979332 RepID=UPI0007CD8CCA|nr:class I SAM-dependent methyltransferase [Prescottella equi]MCD7052638.1 class I SAM-dependent methyltransferase [Rhodococcus sp. BH2-1]MBM4525113.1 methyltransferase domain-containing protein [Prescottella equi]MBM4556436.1 methyltransferase domain-containing protein [Prescottella equi]MBM4650918.1 methyltransferase domain-containing protein [Prescottella equi]MBM4686735.1 methyltransferase domain-containing protein [Prescottella equi]
MHIADAIAANRANWNERADVHASSQMYDVDGFLADPERISTVVRNDLSVLEPHLSGTGIRGRSLLHLQCHIGTDTISWARLGAVDVHGVDLSPNSLRHASRIAVADGREIRWLEGDVRFASSLVDRSFDVVVTSVGTIAWLPELGDWARSIHDLLVPGGVFMIRDDHPILGAMDHEPWSICDDYLGGDGYRSYDDSGSYTENSAGRISQVTNYEWRHDLGEVVGALLDAGLVIEALAELPYMDWPAFEDLVPCPQGWELRQGAPRIPLSFAVVARRPSA